MPDFTALPLIQCRNFNAQERDNFVVSEYYSLLQNITCILIYNFQYYLEAA